MPRAKPAKYLRPGFLLVFLCFAVYANALSGEFIWDDHLQVVRNMNIRTLENIPRAFTSSLWSFMYSGNEGASHRAFDRYYRPFQTTYYVLGYRVGGLSPFVYHLMNLMLHSAATLLVYALCVELGLSSTIALIAAALFAAHPVHTEAVSWIASIGDVSCGVFYAGGLLAFLRFLRDQRRTSLFVSSILFLAALFSKEMAITFPLVACLLICTLPKKQRPALKQATLIVASFVIVTGVYVLFRIAAVGWNLPEATHEDAGIFDWMTLGLSLVGRYIQYAVVPYPLYVYHLIPIHV